MTGAHNTYSTAGVDGITVPTRIPIMNAGNIPKPPREWLAQPASLRIEISTLVGVQWPDIAINHQRLFNSLVKQWYAERGFSSSSSVISSCPAYIRIIEMGEKALPLILRKMREEADKPDHWFGALKAITGEDPVNKEDWGNGLKMARAWFSWAKRKDVAY